MKGTRTRALVELPSSRLSLIQLQWIDYHQFSYFLHSAARTQRPLTTEGETKWEVGRTGEVYLVKVTRASSRWIGQHCVAERPVAAGV